MDAVEIYEKAAWDVDHSKITLGEFEKRIKALYDVEPVRHGHWKTDRYGNLLCSECKGFALYLETGCYVNRHMGQHKSDYCPNCGARMDGEEE